ncbi:MAG: outer membrane protein assembly factor BamB [Gammaproteobacteria bacterium]
MTPVLRALVFGLVVALTGCGGMNAVGDFLKGETSNAIAPTELDEDFEATRKVEEVWSKRIGKGAEELYLKLTPAVIGDFLFVADRYGNLAATDLETGTVTWKIRDKNVNYTSGPGGGDGMVLIGTGDGRVIAREAATGKLRWVAKVSSEVLAAPRAADGVSVVRTGDGNLFGLNSQTGAEIWNYDRSVPSLTLRGNAAPVIDDDLVLAGFDNGRLVALDLKTGQPRWDSPLAIPSGRSDLERMVDVDAEPVVVGATVYVASFHGGVSAMSIIDGQIEWTREISSYAEISVGDGRVYVTDESGSVWALDRETGASVWKQDGLRHRFVTAPVFHRGAVIVGDFEGYVHWLDADTGEFTFRERIDKNRIIAPAIGAGGLLLSYSSGGRLVAMRAQ